MNNSLIELFMAKQTYFLLVLTIFILQPAKLLLSQDFKQKPEKVDKPVFFMKTKPLKKLKAIVPEQAKPGEKDGEVENLNKPVGEISDASDFVDPVWQKDYPENKPGEIIQNFEGINNLQYVLPPDTEGDVGKDHYIQMVNMSFAIFDKSGNLVYGPASNLSVWQEAPGHWSDFSNGDPIVLYDEVADRWLMSELSSPYHPQSPHYIKIAISETSDPLGSWYLYAFEYDYFCDYPKMGVWHDGYYLTTNNNFWINNQWDFHAVGLSVFERDSLLTGSPNARRFFYDFYPNQQPWSMLPADFDGPVPDADTPAYLAYLREGSTDRIFLYKVNTDWQNINNSTVQWQNTLLPEPFSDNLPDGVSQPENGPYLAAMTNRLMYRLQFRQFEHYNVLLANHTVNRGDFIAGIRWYEFRDEGKGWEINQQGTYAPDHTHRWMGSIAMDGYGNIAAGYSVSGLSTYPSIRVAGRTAQGEPGIFNVAEQSIIEGTGYQANPNHRWGDYSAMMVDPTDQTTFWYTQQYYETTSDRSWQTRIAAIRINDLLELTTSAAQNTICTGDSTQLFAMVQGGSSNYSFSWESNPPGFSSNEQNPIISPQENTQYICSVNDEVNRVSDSIQIFVNQSPLVWAGADTVICVNHHLALIQATAQNHDGSLWSTSGDGIFGNPQSLQPIYFPGEGDINNQLVFLELTGFPLAGCEAVSDTLELLIDPCTTIPDLTSTNEWIHIFPNPGNGNLFLAYHPGLSEIVKCLVFNMNGTIVLNQDSDISPNTNVVNLDLTHLPDGVYLIQITSENFEKSSRIIINQ